MSWVPNLDEEVWYLDPTNGNEPLRATISRRADAPGIGYEFSLLFEEEGQMDGISLEYLTPRKRTSPRRQKMRANSDSCEIVISDNDDDTGDEVPCANPKKKGKSDDNTVTILARSTLVKDSEGTYSAAKIGEDLVIKIPTEVMSCLEIELLQC